MRIYHEKEIRVAVFIKIEEGVEGRLLERRRGEVTTIAVVLFGEEHRYGKAFRMKETTGRFRRLPTMFDEDLFARVFHALEHAAAEGLISRCVIPDKEGRKNDFVWETRFCDHNKALSFLREAVSRRTWVVRSLGTRIREEFTIDPGRA